MALIVDLPLVRLTHQVLFPRRHCRTAGMSIVGIPQRVGSGVKIWEVEIGIGTDYEPERIKAFEAFLAGLTCETIVRIPLYDLYGYGSGYPTPGSMEPWADGTWFSDGTGWVNSNNVVNGVRVTTGVAAGGNSLLLKLTAPNVPPLKRGDYFSHNGFIYCVQTSAANGTITFAPRARRAIPDGSAVETKPLMFYGRPDGDDFGRRGRDIISMAPAITLSFVEAFDR